MTNSKMFFLLFFCSIFSQNVALGSYHEEFDLFNANNEPQDKISNQSFRKTSSVTPLNPESLEEDPFFEIEGLSKNNKENSNPSATPTPLSDSFTRQNTPPIAPVFFLPTFLRTADELAASIASRATPEEIYRKSRRRPSSTFSTSATPHGQS